jgi:Na+-transporting methylmalonyl-CoA/oxaloacetate decarboxylase gamma subunit
MRRYLFAFLLALIAVMVLMGAMVDAASAQEAKPPRQEITDPDKLTDPEIIKAIDAIIDELWPVFIERQDAYLKMTGRYFQALDSHDGDRPQNGVGKYPPGWFSHPTDQQYRWADFDAIKFEPMSFNARIDVYDGPEGQGWVICYQADLGALWERCRNNGPEILRNTEWHEVERP